MLFLLFTVQRRGRNVSVVDRIALYHEREGGRVLSNFVGSVHTIRLDFVGFLPFFIERQCEVRVKCLRHYLDGHLRNKRGQDFGQLRLVGCVHCRREANDD